jgi:hypothetical protein
VFDSNTEEANVKASELIARLEQMIDQHGDQDVAIVDPEYGDTDDVQEVHYSKGEIIIG